VQEINSFTKKRKNWAEDCLVCARIPSAALQKKRRGEKGR
jgi:hypothetical protein